MIIIYLNSKSQLCRQKIQDESRRNTDLQIALIKFENHVKVLENKIEMFSAKESTTDELTAVINISKIIHMFQTFSTK